MSTQPERPIPEGLWKLNQERSRLLVPKKASLWIVKNSPQELAFVAVETDENAQTKVHSWQGRYGGPPSVMHGSGIEARLTSRYEDGITTEGSFPGIGNFSEVCRLSDDGKRMVCDGEVKTPDGTLTYHEEFDWYGESPHAR